MSLLLLAIAPGIAICFFIYLKDKYNKEPLKFLIVCFLLGILSALPSIVVEIVAGKLADTYIQPLLNSFIYTVFNAFVIVAFTEEYFKYIMLKKYAFKKSAFDEPFDGIVYSVFVSMGFATIENIGYVYQHGIGTGIMRMFLSVPAHASFAVLMGYYVGMAKFNPEKKSALLLKGLLMATLFHGLFDAFLFLAENNSVTKFVSSGLLILGAIASYFLAIRLSLKSIKLQQTLSRNTYEDNQSDYEKS
jgi:RsiW-degrading membrane proteinase PrsW (M82 family)